MPTFKSIVKMTAQVIITTYASICISELVGDLFDTLVGDA